MADHKFTPSTTTGDPSYSFDTCTVNGPNGEVPIGKQGFGVAGSFTYVSAANGLPVAQQGAWTVGLAAGAAVIGHVIVDTAPTTPVTGTFWQATQPVSGTFWQATQPVSAAQISSAATLADATANPSTGLIGTLPAVYNGSTWDRFKSASAANLAANSGAGAALAIGPGCWTAVSAPAAATQATVTKAAGGAGVRHVCRSIAASIAAGATAQGPVNVYLRDGLTGAGTILWAAALAAVADGMGHVEVSGLNIVGSAATAMTLEFSAAGVASSLEAVTLGGFDAS